MLGKILVGLAGALLLSQVAAPQPASADPNYARATWHGKAGKGKSCSRAYPAATIFGTRYGAAFGNVWDGQCYSCPKGCVRNADPQIKYGHKGCSCPARTESRYARATRHAKVKFLKKCPSGQFVHAFNQTCYSCPRHYKRTTAKIGSAKACRRRVKIAASTKTAKKRGAPVGRCAKGQFHDPRNGGTCWSCPPYYDRTIFPVNGDKACQRR